MSYASIRHASCSRCTHYSLLLLQGTLADAREIRDISAYWFPSAPHRRRFGSLLQNQDQSRYNYSRVQVPRWNHRRSRFEGYRWFLHWLVHLLFRFLLVKKLTMSYPYSFGNGQEGYRDQPLLIGNYGRRSWYVFISKLSRMPETLTTLC